MALCYVTHFYSRFQHSFFLAKMERLICGAGPMFTVYCFAYDPNQMPRDVSVPFILAP
jgi:hypothetical protein